MNMIIECEQCHTKFRLDDTLLKETGSKVRCSKCNYKFIVFAPKTEDHIERGAPEISEGAGITPSEEPIKEGRPVSDFDKTLIGTDIVEGPEAVPSKEATEEEESDSNADKAIAEEISQEEAMQPISFDDISQIDSGIIRAEAPDIKEAMDRASRLEKEIIAKTERGKDEEAKKAKELVTPRPAIKKGRRPGLLLTVLIVILIFVGATSALVFLKPDLFSDFIPFLKKPPSKEQALDMGNRRLSFGNLKGSFVDSKKAGKLFVVTGLVTNNYPDERNYIRIKSNILDSKGKVTMSKIVYAGNPISDRDLQILSMEEIHKRLMNRAGNNNINIDIVSKSSVPLMIVFDNLPEDVSEFTVEAISSSPAKR
jgi:predicted Zn finger-like uncharacterized protein